MKTEKKRQSLKVIISEACMVLTVIITVSILAMLVSGYWINSDLEVERQGMLQISSVPTGANINIDGVDSSWLERTNISKVVTSGEHTITLSKDGYDTWSKTVDVREGLLYRLHYPRLFPKNRTRESVASTSGATFGVMSSDHNSLLLTNSTTEWNYIKLNSNNIKPKTIEISDYFSCVSLAENATTGLFTGQILDADWDYDATHLLFKVQNGDSTEWVLLDVNNPSKSININKTFSSDFSDIKILDDSSNTLLAIQNGDLHKIDIAGRSVSAVIAKNVLNFDHYHNEIVFSAKDPETSDYYIAYFKVGDENTTKLTQTSSPAQVTISQFYDEKYITTLIENQITVYKKDDFTEFAKYSATFNPASIEVGHNGEFIILYTGSQIAILDMEANLIREWQPDGSNFDWIDNDMVYSVKNGELIVYDFDGLNRRIIAQNVSDHFPAGITDNKWLYYFSDDNLIRENLTANN